ncbi:MAG: pyruvate:ferredoxin (flavodoxin) oxidoreductase [Clostridiales bacterium]|jgi:pyruvate-ferredoxin/flavodoxin oxidoreductase|nr:pyruvate:ferredoxin (flavodoxin) oxidoreductase [Clostridiales bacterium]
MARKLKTMDGNTAAAHVAYAFTEVAAIYPITPSSVMAELVDEWSANGLKNIFGQPVNVIEMQSEGGAAGAVHGSIITGALTSTFTASQGLLLMIPNMYKIAGEMLPGVIHVSARALATHALSIFGDHSDVMSCRSTGYAMLASGNPQEVMDLGAVAHLASVKGSLPFLHFFDGFRTSHEMQKIEVWDYDELRDMLDMDAVTKFRDRANLPSHPVLRGSAQNPDIFFQAREAVNTAYLKLPEIVQDYMNQINTRLGTDYQLFNYYGAPDAEYVMVAMGSVCDTAEEVVDYLNAKGEKTGLIKVRLYRPFSVEHFIKSLPKTVKRVVVLDRTKEPGAIGEPLYQDVVTAITGTEFANVSVIGGRYGLGSKDTTPGSIISAFKNAKAENPINHFTISIVDDVTGLSLPITEEPDTTPKGTISCKFWGLGSDGTVGANKNSIKIIGDNTDMKVQAYFQYDSKKSGGVTVSHLRFGNSPIKSSYYVNKADFVACHAPSYIEKFDIVQDIKPGGIFLLNCSWNVDELTARLPAAAKKYLAENNIKFYTVDAIHLAAEIGLGGRTNTILQSAFFKLSNILPIDTAVKAMKDAIVESYGHKGEKVINMNMAAVDAGLNNIKEISIPESWRNPAPDVSTEPIKTDRPDLDKYINDIMIPANSMRGDSIPVSAFMPTADGRIPQGTAAFEKRGIAVNVPHWISENCIQCNQCSYVCPHAAIRPFVFNAEELKNAPAGTVTKKMTGKGCEEFQFAIIASPLDCTGCGSCANICPSKNKALVMEPLENRVSTQEQFDYAVKNLSDKELPFAETTVKGSQFKKPLFEFSGACAGCGETPYARLITQLFGDRMLIANATGCSSIWGGSAPSTPYTVNKAGCGPAWSNSLFEDNAEFGFGMLAAVKQRRAKLEDVVRKLIEVEYCSEKLKEAGKAWLDAMDDGKTSKIAGAALIEACKDGIDVDLTGTQWEAEWLANGRVCQCEACDLAREVLSMSDLLVKPSIWCFGGDGWAYDIGYGGLDHVLASGENINIFVFDTEVYSNTGGQASKASQIGQVAQFAAAGKSVKKKDLAQIAISYGYVYVAQISMGADYNQTLKAIIEAESYDGPSLIIAYAPCINHGSRNGMGKSMTTSKEAVEAGYWNLFRFDPRLEAEGENPLTIDSKPPTKSYNDFIMSEVRYSSLPLSFPERAEKLFKEAEENARIRYEKLVAQRDMYNKK